MYKNNKLNQNKQGSLRNPNLIYDSRQNKLTNDSTNINFSPLYYVGDRVSNLGSSFNPNANVTLRFGNKNSLYKIYGNLTNYPGNLYPTRKETTFVNLTSDGKYYNSNKIIKTDNLGSYLKFGKKKYYF